MALALSHSELQVQIASFITDMIHLKAIDAGGMLYIR